MVALEPHQFEALRKLHQLGGRGGVFIDRGGGKTRVALLYCALRKSKRVLVVCPFSVPSVWEAERIKIGWDVPVLDLTAYASVSIKRDKLRAWSRDGIVLVNYESYWRAPLKEEILRWMPDAVILDEVHRIRHRMAKLSRFAYTFAQKGVSTRLALTGTPISNGLQDVWSIFRFIDPTLFGNYADFESKYIVKGGFRGYEIKGYRNEAVAERIISAHSFQWEGDLPAPPDIPIRVRLSAKSQKVYDALKKHSIAQLTESGQEHVVIAPLVLTLIMRLQQVTSGFMHDDNGDDVLLGTEKADAALDLIEDTLAERQKVVLFARFTHDLDLMEKMLRAKDIAYGRIDGSKTGPERKAAMWGLDKGSLDVLLVQIGAGSEGIDLAAASVAIFYSVNYSTHQFLQAKGRLSGALRQRHPVTYYHLLAEKTIDEKVYAVLSNKMDVAARFTSLTSSLQFLEVDKSNEPSVS